MIDLEQGPWIWLKQELDRWLELGAAAEFWWRDDDAVSVTPQLQQLCLLSDRYSVPLSLAVIPQNLQSDLPSYLNDYPQLTVLQHGFAHISHATPGQRKLELGGSWSSKEAMPCLLQGRERLQEAFTGQFVEVMVPPWNRISEELSEALGAAGYRGLSTLKARKPGSRESGLKIFNTHLDPINWRHGARFLGAYPCIAVLVQHLIAKRCGYRDQDEPTGLLTHHLVQNQAVWRFTESLLDFLNRHPAASWSDARRLWAGSPGTI